MGSLFTHPALPHLAPSRAPAPLLTSRLPPYRRPCGFVRLSGERDRESPAPLNVGSRRFPSAPCRRDTIAIIAIFAQDSREAHEAPVGEESTKAASDTHNPFFPSTVICPRTHKIVPAVPRRPCIFVVGFELADPSKISSPYFTAASFIWLHVCGFYSDFRYFGSL